MIQAVSPEFVDSKLINIFVLIYNFLTPIVFPIALIGFLLIFICLIFGAALHSKTIKRMAAVDFGVLTISLIFYFCLPLFIGLLKTIQMSLK